MHCLLIAYIIYICEMIFDCWMNGVGYITSGLQRIYPNNIIGERALVGIFICMNAVDCCCSAKVHVREGISPMFAFYAQGFPQEDILYPRSCLRKENI
jgi:hypothetical protein